MVRRFDWGKFSPPQNYPWVFSFRLVLRETPPKKREALMFFFGLMLGFFSLCFLDVFAIKWPAL